MMMRIVEIASLPNGAHRNQTVPEPQFKTLNEQGELVVVADIPDGWAVIPDDMKLENFPFGKVTAEEVDGVMTVTKWEPGTLPEVEEPEQPVSAVEQLRADMYKEIDAVWDQMAEAYGEGVQEA